MCRSNKNEMRAVQETAKQLQMEGEIERSSESRERVKIHSNACHFIHGLSCRNRRCYKMASLLNGENENFPGGMSMVNKRAAALKKACIVIARQ